MPPEPITGTARTILKPGVSVGPRIMLARARESAVGSVTAITIANVEPIAPLVNHLWPLIIQLSPSRTAVVRRLVGSDPATSGSVIAKHERTSPAASGRRYLSFWSGVAATSNNSALPASGAALPKRRGATTDLPTISLRSE